MKLIDPSVLKEQDFQDFSNADVFYAIDHCPTIDAEPVKYATWEDPTPERCWTWDKRAYRQCSSCKNKVFIPSKYVYCPFCKATIVKEER